MAKRLVLSLLAGCIVALWASPSSAAPQVKVGIEAWNTGIRGNIYKPETASVAFNYLSMDRHWNPNFILVFSTPAWWPDIRAEYGLMQSNGSATASVPTCILGYTVKGDVKSQIAIKQGRILFDWNLIHNKLVDFQAGLDLRWVTLNMPVSAEVAWQRCGSSGPPGGPPGGMASANYSAGVVSWLPAAHLGVTIHLPFDLDVFFHGSGLPYASNYIYDFRAALEYHITPHWSIMAGYRRWRLHLEDTSFSVNGTIDFKGPYAGLFWSF